LPALQGCRPGTGIRWGPSGRACPSSSTTTPPTSSTASLRSKSIPTLYICYYYSSLRSDDTYVLIISTYYLSFMYVFNFILKKKRKFLIYGTHAGCKLRRIQHRSKSLGGQEVPRRVPLPCSGRHLIWYYPEQFYRGGSTSSLSVMRKEYSNHITTELVCVK
jgi:hypothetical protein